MSYRKILEALVSLFCCQGCCCLQLLSPSSFGAVDIPLQRLGSITLDNVERELRPVIGVDTEAANITRNLEAVQAVLEDAESRQLKEDIVRLWLNDLTQLCYEMEDVLDENTEVQKAEWRNKKMEVKMALLPRRSILLHLVTYQ
ncbi:uncharacterized protein LOC133737722 isoform X2 [Rosa rugosa]|uniref:uncharacterized protein LOC133737722 isoform X2 n=1 Tax=Rosa rugosa TaxID=74645 RepID=UPI002B400A6B|nr:uncharacterized protein LOC133737722 isoform X2 [Rosa rugosa]